MELKLLWMGAVNMPAYHAAAENADQDQCDNCHPEEFIERCEGPFTVTPGCNLLAHMLPASWGFVPDTVDESVLSDGDVWWALGVSDSLGREISIVMESEPDVDYGYDYYRFIIRTTNQPRTMTDIQELIEKYEPQIDHWWCHRNTSANPSKKENENETEDPKQSWEIVVVDPADFIEKLQWLLRRGNKEHVGDHIKLRLSLESDLVVARLMLSGKVVPTAYFEVGDIIGTVSTTVHDSEVDVVVYYNAFMKEIECDPAKVDSIVISYDEEKSDALKIDFQRSVSVALHHCLTTNL